MRTLLLLLLLCHVGALVTAAPSNGPTPAPSPHPTARPTTAAPTSKTPTAHPTSKSPTSKAPTTKTPTADPTSQAPTTKTPTVHPTSKAPTGHPSKSPTHRVTHSPTFQKFTTVAVASWCDECDPDEVSLLGHMLHVYPSGECGGNAFDPYSLVVDCTHRTIDVYSDGLCSPGALVGRTTLDCQVSPVVNFTGGSVSEVVDMLESVNFECVPASSLELVELQLFDTPFLGDPYYYSPQEVGGCTNATTVARSVLQLGCGGIINEEFIALDVSVQPEGTLPELVIRQYKEGPFEYFIEREANCPQADPGIIPFGVSVDLLPAATCGWFTSYELNGGGLPGTEVIWQSVGKPITLG